MRKNEFNSLDEFKSQYVGIWAPSEGHWLGLDFAYNGKVYRLSTGPMYAQESTVMADGREVIFCVYRQNMDNESGQEFVLLGAFAGMEDLLESTCIDGIAFSIVIMDDNTELLGQD